MHRLIVAVALTSLVGLSACQTTPTDDPDFKGYTRSGANRAKTDDPIKSLQKY